jgi:hypothetical protein
MKQERGFQTHGPVTHEELIPTSVDELRNQHDDLPVGSSGGEITQPGQETLEESPIR